MCGTGGYTAEAAEVLERCARYTRLAYMFHCAHSAPGLKQDGHRATHVVHCPHRAPHLPLGALRSPCTMCGTGR